LAARRTIDQTFDSLRSAGRIGLLPFVPAGFPDLSVTVALLQELESAGADLIEIGFPFTDPIADGPLIQEAFTAALASGIRVADIFEAIEPMRRNLSLPLVAMVSYSIVFRYGLKRFLDESKWAGFDGIILPDLPPPEAHSVCETVRQAGLDTVMLVAPTTPIDRRREIVGLCSGFAFYLSVSGTTGERDRLPPDVIENVRQLRSIRDCPVCVGFGISSPAHVASLKGVADGVIVGSALVRRIKETQADPPAAIARHAGAFCRTLMAQL
jgi:tryptophan synthase alpha chain